MAGFSRASRAFSQLCRKIIHRDRSTWHSSARWRRRLRPFKGEDGLWRPGLLDGTAYRYPEISGSSFFTYGFAYGINSGILERSKYLPVTQKAWKGLLSHVYEDGRLGSIQPIGAAPDAYTPTSSYVFGTGAFLLAGSEVYKLAH